MRWIYTRGRPYTPFDLEASRRINDGILDASKINRDRLPDYHSLNIRVDKRFFFRGSDLIIYLSIWNAYNRKNIYDYYWNVKDNYLGKNDQFSMMPIVGVEFEF